MIKKSPINRKIPAIKAGTTQATIKHKNGSKKANPKQAQGFTSKDKLVQRLPKTFSIKFMLAPNMVFVSFKSAEKVFQILQKRLPFPVEY